MNRVPNFVGTILSIIIAEGMRAQISHTHFNAYTHTYTPTSTLFSLSVVRFMPHKFSPTSSFAKIQDQQAMNGSLSLYVYISCTHTHTIRFCVSVCMCLFCSAFLILKRQGLLRGVNKQADGKVEM